MTNWRPVLPFVGRISHQIMKNHLSIFKLRRRSFFLMTKKCTLDISQGFYFDKNCIKNV